MIHQIQQKQDGPGKERGDDREREGCMFQPVPLPNGPERDAHTVSFSIPRVASVHPQRFGIPDFLGKIDGATLNEPLYFYGATTSFPVAQRHT